MAVETFEGVEEVLFKMPGDEQAEVAEARLEDPYRVWSEAIARRRAQCPGETFDVCAAE